MTCITNHEAARVAASEQDEFDLARLQSTRLTLLRRNDRNQQDNLCAGLRIQILVQGLGARIISRADVRQYGQVDGLAAGNVSHVLDLLSGYTILYAGAGCNMHRLDILSHIKSRKWEGGRNP